MLPSSLALQNTENFSRKLVVALHRESVLAFCRVYVPKSTTSPRHFTPPHTPPLSFYFSEGDTCSPDNTAIWAYRPEDERQLSITGEDVNSEPRLSGKLRGIGHRCAVK